MRHFGHYLPSYYLTSKPFVLNFIINFLLILIIYLINQSKLKNKLLNKLLIYSISSSFIFNLLQYIFVEVFKNKLFIKIGISYLTITSTFFYILALIYFIYLLSLKYDYIMIYANSLNKFKNITLNLINSKIIYSLIFLTVVFSFLNLNNNSIKINNSYSKQLGTYIKSNNYDKKSEFIFDDELKLIFTYPRELGGINIYYDDYFPFSTSHFHEWKKRKVLITKLNECINSNAPKCHLQNNKNIYYISKEYQSNLSGERKSVNIDDSKFYIERI